MSNESVEAERTFEEVCATCSEGELFWTIKNIDDAMVQMTVDKGTYEAALTPEMYALRVKLAYAISQVTRFDVSRVVDETGLPTAEYAAWFESCRDRANYSRYPTSSVAGSRFS